MPRKTILRDDDSANRHTLAKTKRFMNNNQALAELPDTPPAYMKGGLAEIYKEVVKLIKENSPAVKRVDGMIVNDLATAVYNTREAQKALDERGHYYENSNGNLTANPALKQQEGWIKQTATLAEKLGLTPSSRASLIEINKPSQEKEAHQQQKDLSQMFS